MTKLGEPVTEQIHTIRKSVKQILDEYNFKYIDADSITTGKDFLRKIWDLIVSVPFGIAIIHEGISHQTMANIFYEIGLLHGLGKDTIVIKSKNVEVPSDFVRTEYIEYNKYAMRRLGNFLQGLEYRVDYLVTVAQQVERNPLLAIDYYRRAYLLSGDESLKQAVLEIFAEANFSNRAKNSVEMLLAGFAITNGNGYKEVAVSKD